MSSNGESPLQTQSEHLLPCISSGVTGLCGWDATEVVPGDTLERRDLFYVSISVTPAEGIGLYVPTPLAVEICREALMDETVPESDPMVEDFVAELANTIGGLMTRALEANAVSHDLGLPDIVSTTAEAVRPTFNGPLHQFRTERGDFWVRIGGDKPG